MCIKQSKKFRCKHEKISWLPCKDAADHQLILQNPYTDSNGEVRHFTTSNVCCSTDCCQKDLDRRMQDFEDVEGFWTPEDAPLKVLMSHRNVSHGLDKPKMRLSVAKEKVENGLKYHFLQCLRSHCQGKGINNEDRLSSGEPLHDPQAPRIP